MSDRFAALTVTLASNISDEDAKDLVAAMQQFRNVIDVRPVVADVNTHIGCMRARRELIDKLAGVLSS